MGRDERMQPYVTVFISPGSYSNKPRFEPGFVANIRSQQRALPRMPRDTFLVEVSLDLHIFSIEDRGSGSSPDGIMA